jgi:hypothetical protein
MDVVNQQTSGAHHPAPFDHRPPLIWHRNRPWSLCGRHRRESAEASYFFLAHLMVDLQNIHHLILVGGFNHLEKYESQWEGLSMIIPYIVENKKCLKPPTI